ncbi:hypothetical protein H7I53_01100 [Mycolicibacterium pulveris]|uniref:Lipoprotein LpqN n=1 Tax=Mycolicibacterium pulveris TaxID=36813 RepID=A0A7I7UET7_MYCPV|nr:hypothetical protein [Mycolicibacterium pulveris]MCV6978820.1 hypothetical protein [Mycolicibacterium pulveris]BBY79978.1 hypothetical protein MPUL_11360 [Mycolicibacterium pulveris]
MPARWTALVALGLAAGAVSACERTDVGDPVAADVAVPATSTPSTRAIPTPQTELTEPGIVSTTRTPVPAGEVTCEPPNPPPVGVTATVADPAAPKITVALPEGWSTSAGEGDIGAKLQGQDGVWATVTIVRTQLDPAEAFEKYVNDAMAESEVSSVSVLPAELCGYSGQKLLGTRSDSRENAVEFADRIAHIWTNTNNYLVAVHVEGPADTPGFEPMTSPLMADFAVVLP